MATLPIRKFGDPVLRERAREVEQVTDLHRRLVKDMIETMRAAPGVGLAGNQVGILERIFVWETEDDFGAVINPVVTHSSEDTFEDVEGCLSIPGVNYPVERPFSVVVEGLDETGAPVKIEAEDHMARICQHEIDHLDGILFIDRLTEDFRRQALTEIREQALGLPSLQHRDGEAL